MARIFYVHWNKPEALATVHELSSWGHSVVHETADGSECCRRIKDTGCDVVVISLSRLPSHGRTVAEHLSTMKATREIPIIFVDGDTGKLPSIRSSVPKAKFVTSESLRSALDCVLLAP